MKLIGLTGGIGSGKSTVAELLRKRGWEVISSDDTGKEVLESSDLHQELIDLFGLNVIQNGKVDRGLIASSVFDDSATGAAKLKQLNQIVHPRVIEKHTELIQQRIASGSPLLVIESALIYEVGLEDGFDWTIVVDASEDVCVEHAMKGMGLTRHQVLARIREQMPSKEKRTLADFVIENNGTLKELEQAVDTIATIIELLPQPSS